MSPAPLERPGLWPTPLEGADMTDAICAHCSTGFTPKLRARVATLYCSPSCRSKAQRERDKTRIPGYDAARLRRRKRPGVAARKLARAARGTKGRSVLVAGYCSKCAAPFTVKGSRHTRCHTCAPSRTSPSLRPAAPPPRLRPDGGHGPSLLRSGIEANDPALVLAGIKERVAVDGDGCWVWPTLKPNGYPREYKFTKRGKHHSFQVYRLALEAKLRAPLGTQAAHHMCAKRACVNPDHLQPVTYAENTAEMLARSAYTDRIAELEAALAHLSPEHHLLCVAPVAGILRAS